MKSLTAAAGVLLLLALASGALAGTADSGVVRLDSGPVRGFLDQGVRAFLGIPYAAPPVGALRWKAPQPPLAWTQVRDCAAFGPACPQPRQAEGGNFSEDCLYLNVWTPAAKPQARLPVMVWIHGGGFVVGSAAWPEYQGRNLARKGVVLVTLNYRLGPLGYLVHPALSQESPDQTSGNYGLLDQIAALRWVQRNIAAFGGDPGNVTLFGQSAGSRSVSLLLLSPLSDGLFQRAIAQSGGPMLGSEHLNPVFNGDMAAVSAMGEVLAQRLGCDQAPDVLAAMRAKSAQEVLQAANTSTSIFTKSLFFAPVFDGRVLPDNPVTAFREGRQHRVPLITGSTLNEGTFYLGGPEVLTLDLYKEFLRARFGAHAAEALAVFPASGDADVARAIDQFLAAAANAEPSRFMVRSMERTGTKAWLYQFTRRPDTDLARTMGVHHGVDLAYVFGNMQARGYDARDKALSETVMGYWVNFARTGDPNGPGLPAWPAYQAATDLNLEIGDQVRPNAHLFLQECDFLESQWPYGRWGAAKP